MGYISDSGAYERVFYPKIEKGQLLGYIGKKGKLKGREEVVG